MEDTTTNRPVDFDYDASVQELFELIDRENATFGVDAKVAGEDYFKTEFRVAHNPAEIKKFDPPADLVNNATGALKEREIESLVKNLQQDDYYLIHFPLIIKTKFPFDFIELNVQLLDENPGYSFVGAFPESKANTVLDGKLTGSVSAEGEFGLSLKTPDELKELANMGGGVKADTKHSFSLNYNFPFSIKNTYVTRNGGNNTWSVIWNFKRAPDGSGLDETVENITLLIKKPKDLMFSGIRLSGIGNRKEGIWPKWLLKLLRGLPFENAPRAHTLVKEGFTIRLNRGEEVTWPAELFEAHK